MTSGWGVDEPAGTPWRAGRWSLVISADELADLAIDDRPVLRSIRAVVRDRDWRTVPPAVEGVTATDRSLRLLLRFAGLGADLRGELAVDAADDRLTAVLELRSRTTFDRNRIGLVVLHGADVAGRVLAVMHGDGTTTSTRFPEAISPHQPAVDVRGLAWDVPGLHARLAFDGEVFEMEDQRNWTDSSFKTYSTPLALPFPVRLRAGDVIRQQVVLTCVPAGAAVAVPPSPTTVSLVPRPGRLPAFATGATTASGSLPRADAATVLVELAAEQPGWRSALARAAAEVGDGALDVRIVADDPAAVRAVVDELAVTSVGVVRMAAFSTSSHVTEPATWTALRDRATEVGLQAELVGGTRAHFTELNRGHTALPEDLPSLTFSSTPQMHAIESRQLVESIVIQRLTARDAVRIAAGRPVHVGPVTLRPRFNAVATTAHSGAATVPGYAAIDRAADDPRQSSAALAAWTVASAAAFAVDGVATVTWFEAAGPRGVRMLDGADLPVRAAVLDLLELSDAPALASSDPPPGISVLAGMVDGRAVALVANLLDEAITMELVWKGAAVQLAVPPLAYRRLAWMPRT